MTHTIRMDRRQFLVDGCRRHRRIGAGVSPAGASRSGSEANEARSHALDGDPAGRHGRDPHRPLRVGAGHASRVWRCWSPRSWNATGARCARNTPTSTSTCGAIASSARCPPAAAAAFATRRSTCAKPARRRARCWSPRRPRSGACRPRSARVAKGVITHAASNRKHDVRQSRSGRVAAGSAERAEAQGSQRLEAHRHLAGALRHPGQDHRQAGLRGRRAPARNGACVHRAMPGVRRQGEELRRIQSQVHARRQESRRTATIGSPSSRTTGGARIRRSRRCRSNGTSARTARCRANRSCSSCAPGSMRRRRPLRARMAMSTRRSGDAAKVVEAEYYAPYLNHATMEPQTATALVKGDKVEVWVGTQNGETTIAAASEASGVPLEKSSCTRCTPAAGSAGAARIRSTPSRRCGSRRACPAHRCGLQWSREEDMQQGRYRPVALVKLRGALDAQDGNWTGWHVRQADQSILHHGASDRYQERHRPGERALLPGQSVRGAELHQRVRDAQYARAARVLARRGAYQQPVIPRMLHRRARACRRQRSVRIPPAAA